jgi:nucleoside-triphosphatase THEP1
VSDVREGWTRLDTQVRPPITLSERLFDRGWTIFGAEPQLYWRVDDGVRCGTACISQRYIEDAVKANERLPWSAGFVAVLLLWAAPLFRWMRTYEPEKSIVNADLSDVVFGPHRNGLPVVRRGRSVYGLFPRPGLKRGRWEMGSIAVVGPPGSGKSTIIRRWLLNDTDFNFLVIDPKGEFARSTAGYRGTLGRVVRLDLSSSGGDGIDPFDVDTEARLQQMLEPMFPAPREGESGAAAHFRSAVRDIALLFLRSAKLAGRPPMQTIIEATQLDVEGLVRFSEQLVTEIPESRRPEVQGRLNRAWGRLLSDPSAGLDNERASAVQSFRAAFAAFDVPEIRDTLTRTTFDVRDLVRRPTTIYLITPSTDEPYKLAVELALQAILTGVRREITLSGRGRDIVFVADEAGALTIPQFSDLVNVGRSQGITVAAFAQTAADLSKYARHGWQDLLGSIHHWCFFPTEEPAVREHLSRRLGTYEVRDERPQAGGKEVYVRRSTFEDLDWREGRVLSLMQYERLYVVQGEAVSHRDRRHLHDRENLPIRSSEGEPRLQAVQGPAKAQIPAELHDPVFRRAWGLSPGESPIGNPDTSLVLPDRTTRFRRLAPGRTAVAQAPAPVVGCGLEEGFDDEEI